GGQYVDGQGRPSRNTILEWGLVVGPVVCEAIGGLNRVAGVLAKARAVQADLESPSSGRARAAGRRVQAAVRGAVRQGIFDPGIVEQVQEVARRLGSVPPDHVLDTRLRAEAVSVLTAIDARVAKLCGAAVDDAVATTDQLHALISCDGQ